MGNKTYFFGGRRGLTICRDINSYDLRTGEWHYLGNLAEAVSYSGLAVQGNQVFIQEGRNLQVYDCRTNDTRLYPLDREMESAAFIWTATTSTSWAAACATAYSFRLRLRCGG